jgi:Zn-dependent protease
MNDLATRLQMLFLQMIPFLGAIVIHEYGHALIAKKFGDNTAEKLGRLTLNPIPHIDPIGTILFPAINILTGINFLFGWARPVPINFSVLRPYRKGLFFTALGGPLANVVLAFISSAIFVALEKYVPPTFYLYEPLIGMSLVAIQINYALCIFNLIPLPPLDGSRVVESFLNYNQVKKFEQLQAYSFIILLVLLWTGVLNILMYPVLLCTEMTVYIFRIIL